MNFSGQFLTLFFITMMGFGRGAQISENPVLGVKIEFGRGPNCDGRGTCSVSDPGSGKANAVFYFDEAGRLQMELKKDEIPKEKIDLQIESDKYQVPEDFIIEKLLMQKLQIDTSYTVKAGAYPMSAD